MAIEKLNWKLEDNMHFVDDGVSVTRSTWQLSNDYSVAKDAPCDALKP
jgi:hypothetical protein